MTACRANQKSCANLCVDLDDVAYGCTPTSCNQATCPAAGAAFECKDGACVIAGCAAGAKLCDGKCVAVSDPTYGCSESDCNASSCPDPGDGTLICNGQTCEVGACTGDTKQCGANCVPLDANHGCADPLDCDSCLGNETCVGAPSACACVADQVETCRSACGEVVDACGDPVQCGDACPSDKPLCVNNRCIECEDVSDCDTGGDACVVASCSNNKCYYLRECDCTSTETFCDPNCVNLKTDAFNCGSCGMACQGASDCVNGACKACSTGCAVLSTTVIDNASRPNVRYGFSLNPPVDLVDATITARLYAASGFRPGTIRVHCDDTTDSSSSGIYTGTSVAASGWFEATMEGVSAPHIDLLELMLDDFGGAGTATLYLDSITISPAVAGPWNFTSSGAPLTYSPGVEVDPKVVSGGVSWRNN
jgi:hypothetical protein